MKRLVLLILVLLFLGTGCAWFKKKQEMSAEELATEGMAQFEKGNYGKSLELFEQLKDWYPFSRYAILADLKVADAHYRKRNYQEAIDAYEQFESLHPRNEAVPYVIYQIGRCYFDQLETPDRDQSVARNAMQTFQRLVAQYPEDTYAYKAKELIRKCTKSITEHEFDVGLFYYKRGNYKAALERFQSILVDYPDVGVHRKALEYIGLCKERLEG